VSSQHPITEGVTEFGLYSHGRLDAYGADAKLLGKDASGIPVMLVWDPSSGFTGKGRIFAITDYDLFSDSFIGEYQNRRLWQNVLDWAAVPEPETLSLLGLAALPLLRLLCK
jgi:hypothetical protein